MQGRGAAYGAALLLLLLALAGGCGYRFTADSGTRLTANQKVWVAYFQNSTVYPNASVQLKRALFDQFTSLRGIQPAADPTEGDLQVEGILTGYSSTALSYTAADTVKDYRLTISATVTVRRRSDGSAAKPLWQGTVTTWQDYPVATTVELQRNSENAALAEAGRKLAQQVIWNVERNY